MENKEMNTSEMINRLCEGMIDANARYEKALDAQSYEPDEFYQKGIFDAYTKVYELIVGKRATLLEEGVLPNE